VSAGFKFNEWELRGVPVRIELGPRDLAAGTVVVVDRLTGAKTPVAAAAAAPTMPARLDGFQRALFERARKFRDSRSVRVDTLDQLAGAVATGFAYAFICEDPACEKKVQERTGATPRCVPADGPDESGPCVVCGRASGYGRRLVFGRAY
jgi:prolyl-tRNA synthetase